MIDLLLFLSVTIFGVSSDQMLYSGDMVALTNTAKLKWVGRTEWLGCSEKLKAPCTLETCPGGEIDGGEWDTCTDVRFRIYADRADGEAIRHGDTVAFQTKWFPGAGNRGYWLSCCCGSICTTRPCPGKTFNFGSDPCGGEKLRIYAPARSGSCTENIPGSCKGDPIEVGDKVFLWYASRGNGTNYWVSAAGGGIRTRPCSGDQIDQSDLTKCALAAWTIVKRDSE